MSAVGEASWHSLTTGQKVALALGVPASATIGYILYHRYKGSTGEKRVGDFGEDSTGSRVTIPADALRSIARRKGSFLKQLQQQSGARVEIEEEEEEDRTSRTFLLLGSPEQVSRARVSIARLVSENQQVTVKMEVPKAAVGRIIGRRGESIKTLCLNSGARVNCSGEKRSHSLGEKGLITITGTRKEVETAKELIMEKVIEEEVFRKKIFQSTAKRQQRKQPSLGQGQRQGEREGDAGAVLGNGTPSSARTPESVQEDQRTTEQDDQDQTDQLESPQDIAKFEIPSPDLSFSPDEHLEVYVSACENPGHFWIQILGVRSLHLDQLTGEMSRFYSSSGQTEEVLNVVAGDIVAAPYRQEGSWHRARVLGFLDNGNVDVYYVDFGDNGEIPPGRIHSLRSDFLSLPFQAIECSLAGICPAAEAWTEEALDEFDRLTYCAEWKPLLAKLCSYFQTGMTTWPNVRLYDHSNGKNLDIGEELIRLGHAVRNQKKGAGDGTGPTEKGDSNPVSLQKMLDDVTGATSELSLSCLSLASGVPERGWVSERLGLQRGGDPAEVMRCDVERPVSPLLLRPPSSPCSLDSAGCFSVSAGELTDVSGELLSPDLNAGIQPTSFSSSPAETELRSASLPPCEATVGNATSTPTAAGKTLKDRQAAAAAAAAAASDRAPDRSLPPPPCLGEKPDSEMEPLLSPVELVTSRLGSVTLSDEVFAGSSRSGSTSSAPETASGSPLSGASFTGDSSLYSPRGCFYFASTSEDSSSLSSSSSSSFSSSSSSSSPSSASVSAEKSMILIDSSCVSPKEQESLGEEEQESRGELEVTREASGAVGEEEEEEEEALDFLARALLEQKLGVSQWDETYDASRLDFLSSGEMELASGEIPGAPDRNFLEEKEEARFFKSVSRKETLTKKKSTLRLPREEDVCDLTKDDGEGDRFDGEGKDRRDVPFEGQDARDRAKEEEDEKEDLIDIAMGFGTGEVIDLPEEGDVTRGQRDTYDLADGKGGGFDRAGRFGTALVDPAGKKLADPVNEDETFQTPGAEREREGAGEENPDEEQRSSDLAKEDGDLVRELGFTSDNASDERDSSDRTQEREDGGHRGARELGTASELKPEDSHRIVTPFGKDEGMSLAIQDRQRFGSTETFWRGDPGVKRPQFQGAVTMSLMMTQCEAQKQGP
ncbi:tudor and KH domain-containing protein isoform X1 [Acipenser ruthenus]|uniref:tudor and KH domain-containing protein isoform X1 n=1 Tax=Acipenser ruthenus TaxID=7906 RepID=UPI00274291F2|nr:tudor and KH domain-containing protein isoform X1 [Acipenser ruthenus]